MGKSNGGGYSSGPYGGGGGYGGGAANPGRNWKKPKSSISMTCADFLGRTCANESDQRWSI